MIKGKYRDLSKNTVLFTVSSVGTKLITLLFVPLYTYVLSTDAYGTADIMNTTVSLLVPVLTVNIQDAVLRFSLDKEYDKKNVINISFRIAFLSSLFLTIVVNAFSFLGIINVGFEYIVFLCFSFFGHATYNSFQMYLKACDKSKIIVIASLLSTLSCCILNVVLLLLIKLGVIGYLISTAASSIISALVCFFGGEIYKDISPKEYNKELAKTMVLYSLPLVFNSLAWWINNASDRYILTYYCGASENGIYSVAYKIPTILSTLQTIFYSAWSISAIKEFDKGDQDGFIGSIYSLYSCVSLIGCSLLLVFNTIIARILYANDFYVAWKYVPLLLVGTLFNGLSLFEGCLFTAVKKTRIVSASTVVGALINTILNFFLIANVGTQGAAIATFVGYFIVFIVRTVLLRKQVISMKVNWFAEFVKFLIIILQACLFILFGFTIAQVLCLLLIVLLDIKPIMKLIKTIIRA